MPQRSLRAARLGLLLVPLLFAFAVRSARADAVATVLPVDGLHLRAGPGTDQPAIDLIPGGTRIAVTGQATPDGWYPVVYHRTAGWVMGSFLAFDDQSAATTRRATVTPPDGLNLRKAPTESAEVITVLRGGTAVTAMGQPTSDGWALVVSAEQSGWVNASYLAFDGAPAAPAAAAAPVASALAASPPVSLSSGPANGIPMKLSYYSQEFEGGPLACGGTYHADDETIAETNRWPCGTVLRICRGSACIMAAVRDRGAMAANELDVSMKAFTRLCTLAEGQIPVTVDVVGQ